MLIAKSWLYARDYFTTWQSAMRGDNNALEEPSGAAAEHPLFGLPSLQFVEHRYHVETLARIVGAINS